MCMLNPEISSHKKKSTMDIYFNFAIEQYYDQDINIK